MKIPALIFILFSFGSLHVSHASVSRKPVFTPLSIQDGLASNDITCIIQDNQGFMWFGSTNGLCRYDGYEFKIYKSNYLTPRLFTGNSIVCLAIDKKDHLWIGTTSGLNIFDLRTGYVRQYTFGQIPGTVINTIAISNNDVAYIGTDRGVSRYDPEKETFELIETDADGNTITGNYIQSLFVDSRNILWIGMWHTGFCALDLSSNRFVYYPEINKVPGMSVTCFYEDKQGNIWFSTWYRDGLHRLKNAHQPEQVQETVYGYKDDKYYPIPIYALVEDDLGGNIWVATSDGLSVLTDPDQPGSFINYNRQNTDKIAFNEIYSIFKDRTGMIWFSVLGAGCCSIDLNRNQFTHQYFPDLKKKEELITITSIYEDENEWLWLGVKSQTLILFNKKDNKIIRYSEHPQLKKINSNANTVLDIVRHSTRNEIWLATRYDGIYLVQTKTSGEIISVEKITENEVLKTPNTNVVEEGPDGSVWVGTTKGMNVLEKDLSGKYVYKSDSLIDRIIGANHIKVLWHDKADCLWVGTQHDGLFKVRFSDQSEPTKVTNYSVGNNKINSNEITSIFGDTKNRLWIGTQGGGLSLYKEESDQFEIIQNMNLMMDDAIYSIEEDKEGNLWLSTGKGLVSYNIEQPLERQVWTFATNNGLDISSFYINASFKNKKNELFYGGNNGLVYFSPDRFTETKYLPTPVITDILISNVSLSGLTEEKRNKIATNIPPFGDVIYLSHKDNNLRIEFSSLSFENPLSKKYAYKLNGVDEDWIYTDANKRFAVYSNLVKGEYVFQVKAYNESGYQSDGTAFLKVIRLPAPWETTGAYLSYFFLAACLSYLTYRIINNRLKLKRALEIEQMQRANSEEVHQAKLQFFTNISHELFTPISVLSCALEDLESEYPGETPQIRMMQMNLKRLMRLLQQILEFRKAETGNLKLKVSQDNIVSFVKEICDVNFASLINRRNISLEFRSSVPSIPAWFDPDKLDKIMFNLLSNAFKYNRENGSIVILVGEKQVDGLSYIVIRVRDTGEGIAREALPNLFKRFYEGDYRKFRTNGTGIGLSLTKDLTELHHGEISVDSRPGEGTEFKICFPIDRAAYPNDEIDDKKTTDEEMLKEDISIPNAASPINESILEKGKNITILLVEDHEELLTVMSHTLTREFHICKARNGKEALAVLEKTKVDLVVTDIVMPEMNGVELCRNMKTEIRWSDIPIILLTAKQHTEDKIEGFEAGADVYITKPFELKTLTANIRSLIKNRKYIAELFKTGKDIQLSDFTYNSVDKEFLEKAVKIVEENVSRPDFDAEAFYEAMNMTQSTLYRKLKTMTNLSPNEFIRNIKFKIACKLLTEKKLNISETAYELGFSDPRYFSITFKKEIGVTPSEYIRRNNELVMP